MPEKFRFYLRLTRMDRPIGWLLLLWPTLWALWIAGDGSPQLNIVAVFVIGTIVMRAAGCIVNDYLDRDLDRHVARTRQRPLVTGEVSPREAAILFVGLIIIALALVLTLMPTLILTLILTFVLTFVLTLILTLTLIF